MPRLPLHEAVFKNDIVKVSALLRDAKDPNLATPEVTDFVRVNLACVAYTSTVLYTIFKKETAKVFTLLYVVRDPILTTPVVTETLFCLTY